MIKGGVVVNSAHVLVLGITFKENCPDVRNTKIIDVIKALGEYGVTTTVYDPWANPEEVMHEYGLVCHNELPTEEFDAVFAGVAHNEFKTLDLKKVCRAVNVVYDFKKIF